MSSKKQPSTLTLTPEQMKALGYRVIDLLVEHFTSVREKPVSRMASRAEMESLFREPLPLDGIGHDAVMEKIARDVVTNIMHLDHPRFFGFVSGPGNFIGAMGDALASGFNVFCSTWIESSSAAEIEIVSVDWIRQILGLPETARGIFTSGGSVANLIGLMAARHVILDDRIADAVCYFSDQTHSSMVRGLRILGFLPHQIKKIPATESYRIDIDGLKKAVAKDRAEGKAPFAVVANAGTTNTGSVDPLHEIADFCQKEGLWYHVDGAYGASAMLSDKGKALLSGIEQADSVSIDPHKWLFQPLEIGCVLLKDGTLLRKTFHVLKEYMQDAERTEEEVNFCDMGLQLTRGFRALKFWMTVKTFGLTAIQDAVSWGVELAEIAEAKMREKPIWEITSPAQLGIITFRYAPPGKTEQELNTINGEIAKKTIGDQFAMLTTTELKERLVLRLCTINPRTTREDIEKTIERLEKFGGEMVG